MKGIILCGGTASRLAPTSFALNKHVLPVYSKPMVYYPLTTLMLCGIKDILITSDERDLYFFQKLLGDGSELGIKISYAAQKNAGGIAEVLLLAEDFIGESNRFAMILGDNIFYIPHIKNTLSPILDLHEGAGILLANVNDPHRFGIAGFNENGALNSVEEKPKNPKSNFAITGLYFYDKMAIEFAKSSGRSVRGELEITTINDEYLKRDRLSYAKMPRGSVWLDAGTPKSLFEASEFVKIIEERQQTKIGVIEEVAYNMGFIDKEQLLKLAQKFKTGCEYGDYLREFFV